MCVFVTFLFEDEVGWAEDSWGRKEKRPNGRLAFSHMPINEAARQSECVP